MGEREGVVGIITSTISPANKFRSTFAFSGLASYLSLLTPFPNAAIIWIHWLGADETEPFRWLNQNRLVCAILALQICSLPGGCANSIKKSGNAHRAFVPRRRNREEVKRLSLLDTNILISPAFQEVRNQ